MTSEVSPKVKLRWKKYIFLYLPLFVPLIRGSLDNARDDGTQSVVFLQGRTTFPGDSSGFSNPLNDKTTLEMTFFGVSSFRPNEVRGEIP